MAPKQAATLLSRPPAFLLPGLLASAARNAPSKIPIRTIRSITKPIPKPSRFNRAMEGQATPTAQSKLAALQRKLPTMPRRPGLLGYKREMSAIYDPATGARTPVTLIQLDRNQVVSHKTRAANGYVAAQMGCGARRHTNVTRPMLGHYAKHDVAPKRELVEFRVATEEGLPRIGTFLRADWFKIGDFVDVRGTSRGMGFAGGMKRHGFHGQPASHGVSLAHRSMGSAGQSQGGGSRVYPGKKMAGRMGGESCTVQGLRVVRVDAENGILVVNGEPFALWRLLNWCASLLFGQDACRARIEGCSSSETRGSTRGRRCQHLKRALMCLPRLLRQLPVEQSHPPETSHTLSALGQV